MWCRLIEVNLLIRYFIFLNAIWDGELARCVAARVKSKKDEYKSVLDNNL